MPLPVLPTWPAGVEWRPRRENYRHQPYDEPQKTEMEGGNVRRVARLADEVIRQTVTWKFEVEEYDTVMEPFFDDVRASGWQGSYVLPGGAVRSGHITVNGLVEVSRKRMVSVAAQLEIIPSDE